MSKACFSCGATIEFVSLEGSSRVMPIDPVPDDRGNVAVVRRGRKLIGYVVSKAWPWKQPYVLHMPHRASCKPDKPRVTLSEHRAKTAGAPALPL